MQMYGILRVNQKLVEECDDEEQVSGVKSIGKGRTAMTNARMHPKS